METDNFLFMEILLKDIYSLYTNINDILNKRADNKNKIDIKEQIERISLFYNDPLLRIFTSYCKLVDEFKKYEALLINKNDFEPENKGLIEDEANRPLSYCSKEINNIMNEIKTIKSQFNKEDQKVKYEHNREKQILREKAKRLQQDEKLRIEIENRKARKKQVPSQDDFLEEDNGKSHSSSLNDDEYKILVDEDFEKTRYKKIIKHIVVTIGDGDCFINAIFDYLIYNNKMQDMYIRLTKLHEVINKKKKYDIEGIKKEASIFNNIIKDSSESYEILKSGNIFLQYSCNTEENGDIKFLPKEVLPNPDYNTLRLDFIKCMKYTLFLYSKTIGRIDNIKYLKDILVDQSFDNDSMERHIKDIINKRILLLVNTGKFDYRLVYSTIEEYTKNIGTQILDYSKFKDVAPNKILTEEDYENIYEYYINYYFHNNGVESERYIIYIYTKILIRKIKSSPFFVIIRAKSDYDPKLYLKKLKTHDDEKHLYIRILNDKMRKTSHYTNHFNLIISKKNTYFNSILKEFKDDALIKGFQASEELAKSLAGEKIVSRDQVGKELKLLEQTQNDEAIARSLEGSFGGKRIQAKSLQKSERVTNDPKKPSPKNPSPKKPCKSKQKSRLT